MKHKISFLCPFTGEKIVKRIMKRKMSCMYTYSRMDKNQDRGRVKGDFVCRIN
jgi:hypothetical protein